MTRLIDADALHDSIDKETYRHTYIEQIHSIIEDAPTIDAVPVVRCKECKYYSEWQNGTGSCQRSENACFWFGVDFNDFCSFGERREP